MRRPDLNPGAIRVMLAATIVYIAVNITLQLASVPFDSLVEADALTYWRMAHQVLESGTFREETRQPLYPLLIAFTVVTAGAKAPILLIGAQCVFLYLTGMVASAMARPYLREGAAAIFPLVVLNPNALGVAHLPLADTLHALLFTLAAWSLLVCARSGRLMHALACGAALGAAALTRPETVFLVYVLPVALPVVVSMTAGRTSLLVGIRLGLVAFVAAGTVMAPWVLHNSTTGLGPSPTGGTKASENARGHYALLVEAATGEPQATVIERLSASEPALLDEVGLAGAPESDKRRFLFRHYIFSIIESDPLVVVRLYIRSWIAQFVAGGAQTLNALLAIPFERPDKFLNQPEPLAVFVESLDGQSRAGLAITVGCIAFAVVLRLLGFLGIVEIVRRRDWVPLVVILTPIAFKAVVHLFYGLARYRLSVEPLLMILAVYGWRLVREKIRHTR
jgi:hypothetical protein